MGWGWVGGRRQQTTPTLSLSTIPPKPHTTHDVAIWESGSVFWKHVHNAGPASAAQSLNELSGGGCATMVVGCGV